MSNESSKLPVELLSYSLFFDIDNARLAHEDELESLIKNFLRFCLLSVTVRCNRHLLPSDHLTLHYATTDCNYNILMLQYLSPPEGHFELLEDLLDTTSTRLTSTLMNKIKEHYKINQKQFNTISYNISIKNTAMSDNTVYS